MDISAVQPWLSSVALLISIAVAVTTYLKKGEAQHTEQLKDHEHRISTLENDMKHLPDRESQNRMELALSEMKGSFAVLEERLKPIAATSQRLHELLMEQAKK